MELAQKWIDKKQGEGLPVELDTTLTLHDLGISAFRGKNATKGKLSLFLKAIQEKRITTGYFLVENLDRLSRNELSESVQLLLTIINSGIIVVSLHDNMEYRKENLNFPELLISIATLQRGREESETKSIRVRDAWNRERAKADSGKATKFRPPSWIETIEKNDERKYRLIPERAKIVKDIFKRFIDGQGSMKISMEYNKQGIPFWGRKTVWDSETIRWILKNPAVIGEYQSSTFEDGEKKQGETYKAFYPAVIYEKTWRLASVRRQKQTNDTGFRNNDTIPNLFTGVARCGVCGNKMLYHTNFRTMKDGSRAKYVNLRCSGYRNGTCKPNVWKYKSFETMIVRFMRYLDYKSLLSNGNSDTMLNDVQAIEFRIKELEAKTERLIDELSDATERTSKVIKGRIEKNEHELEHLEIERIDLNKKYDSMLDVNSTQTFEDILSVIDLINGSDKKAIEARKKIHTSFHNVIDKILIFSSAKIIEIHFKNGAIVKLDQDWQPKYRADVKDTEDGKQERTVKYPDGHTSTLIVDTEDED